MRDNNVLEMANDFLIPEWRAERDRQKTLDRWATVDHELPYKPTEASKEYQELQKKAVRPLIGLVVKIFTQALNVIEYHPSDDSQHDALWQVWNANRMGGRQNRLWSATLRGGLGYVTVLPGSPVPVEKIYSGKNMLAVYQDPEYDEWPMLAIEGHKASRTHWHFRIFDEENVYTLEGNSEGGALKLLERAAHGAPVVPVVRFVSNMDDEGVVTGEVEPLIPIQASIDQSEFDRLLAQTYSSFKVRTVTGLAPPDDDAAAAAEKAKLGHDRILVAEGEGTKFGTLDSTDLQQYIESARAGKQDLATIAQVAHKYIVGAESNEADGAEAQAAGEVSTMRKIGDFAQSFGEGVGQMNRLVGHYLDLPGGFADYMGRTEWEDASIRSLAQNADAVLKLADDRLGIPKEYLWSLLPGVSGDVIKKWQEQAPQSPVQQVLDALK